MAKFKQTQIDFVVTIILLFLQQRTPLHIAARQGDMEKVKHLVDGKADGKADVNARDQKGVSIREGRLIEF